MTNPEPPPWQHGPDCGCYRCKGRFPGLPQGQYPPLKPQRGSDATMGWAIFCGIIAALSLAAVIYLGNDVSECQSTLGQIFGGQQCSTAIELHDVALFFLTVSGVGLLISLIAYFTKKG